MDRAWDSQLDTMLDDLQATVHHGSNGAIQNGVVLQNGPVAQNGVVQYDTIHSISNIQSSRTHTGNALNGGTAYQQLETNTSNGPGQQRSKQSYQYQSEWRSTDTGATDLSSIEKVKSVSKVSSSSTNRYEYSTSGSTHQSIKKNINDLDHLLTNLSSQNSSRDVSPSRRNERPSFHNSRSDHISRSEHNSRSEERREKLIQNSLTRTPSLNRGQSRNMLPSSRPITPVDNYHAPEHLPLGPYKDSPTTYNREPSFSRDSPSLKKDSVPPYREYSTVHKDSREMTNSTQSSLHVNQNSMYSSKVSTSSEFQPVHTTPDPLTGRYADGRITPNHGYTRNFNDPSGRGSDANGGIPTRPDELLHNLGQNIDKRELDQINQNERVTVEKINISKNNNDGYIEPVSTKPGPPVFYPTEEMYSTHRVEAQGVYKASAKGAASSKESEEKGGAAVIPICLPLCCAAPCVIL